MLFILLFFLKFKFSLFFLLFVKIIINLKIIFSFDCENKKSIRVFLKGRNIEIKFIFS